MMLELWKTAGQEDRLQDASPVLLRFIQNWGTVERLLVVRWEPELDFLEPLIDFSPEKNDATFRKQKCDPGMMTELKRLFDDRTAVKIDKPSQIPARFLEMFSLSQPFESSTDSLLWLGRLNPEKAIEAFVLLELRPHDKPLKQNDVDKNTDDFFVFFLESLTVLAAVLKREWKIRRLNQRREAVEAEKDAILTKLGRQDINSETIIGADRGLKRVFERLEMIAATGTPVLLIGETGSGKALVARSIHNRSGRASLPFLRFNCAAVPSELIESQLFGSKQPGAVERAGGGTLFLNDVHLLTASAQSRLLTLLDRGMISQSETSQSKMVDVRVIVATDHDLGVNVAESGFNEELWYRLALFPIRLPALRERVDDLPELALHFAKRAAARFGLPVVLPTDYDIAFLKSYSWPGNVRELGTVLDRAALLGNGKSLDVVTALGVPNDAILAADWNENQKQRSIRRNRWAAFQEVERLDDFVRRYLEHVLDITAGRIEGPNGAAILLDVNANTLRSRLKKLGIDSRQFKKL